MPRFDLTKTRLVTQRIQSYADFTVYDENRGVEVSFTLFCKHETDATLVLNYIPASFLSGVRLETEVAPGPLQGSIQDAVDAAVEKYFPDSKIEAIKAVREVTGIGLKEAKDAIDVVWKTFS